ncbi:MAG TPA: cellulase family glycosylhydrolase [Thermoanaerobaculia bacterium]|jgi:hypothetical protein
MTRIVSIALGFVFSLGGLRVTMHQGRAEPPDGFVRTLGRRLVVDPDNQEVSLRGIGFSSPTLSPPSEDDYEAVQRMGMNTVTLELGYRFFYDPAAPSTYNPLAWSWLDAHVHLARRHRIYLVLQMCDVEGAQFVPAQGLPLDYRIWENGGLQARFVHLWRAIADRYRQEPQIVGYSLFCEPVVSDTVEQWSKLANKTIEEIRRVDQHHILFVERIYGEHAVRREVSGIDLSPERAFFQAQDDDVVYAFYFFDRDEYTHQFAPWRPELRRSITYPEEAMTIPYKEEPSGIRRTFRFDRDYLRFYLSRQTEFGEKHNVPMFFWAFGALHTCFESNRGGSKWLEDVTGLFNASGLHWTAWAYRDKNFGIRDNEEAKRVVARAAKAGQGR